MSSLIFNKALWSLTLGHFSIDLYTGAMPIVMVYLTNSLQLSLDQAGLVFGLYSICSSISQPIFGYLSDRFGGRWFASGGLLWMSILQGLVGFVPDYTTLLIVAPLAGFGSAAFHPHAASSANLASGERKTTGMAIFLLGGNGGFAIGPLLAAVILGFLGLHGTAVMALIGLALAPLLFNLYRHSQRPATQPTPPRVGRRVERNPAFSRWAIIALLVVMSLRAWTQSATSNFMPLFFTSLATFTVAEASKLSFLLLASLALGALVGGFMADRVGGRAVMVIAFLIATPATVALFWARDWSAFITAPIVGFAAGAAWPPTLVMAQELFPRNAGVASGLALGFVFAMGGLGTYLTGVLAAPDHLGLLNSMLLLAVSPILCAFFTFALPSHAAVVKASRMARKPVEPAGVITEAKAS